MAVLDLPPAPRILVYVGLDLVGDAILKLPFVRALRFAYPDAEIVWLAGKGPSAFKDKLGPLVEGLIDVVIDNANIGNKATELVTRPLGSQTFDLVIDTQRRVLTTMILKRIRTRYFVSAAADYYFSSVKPGEGYERPESLSWQLLDLLRLITGEPIQELAPLRIGADINRIVASLLPPGRRYVALAPGAGGRHKCWPLERFAHLARGLSQARVHPVIMLGPAELEWYDYLTAAVPTGLFPLQNQYIRRYDFRGDTTVALAGRCNVAVANDSGIGHLIAASGIPLVSLFGPTDPGKFAPLTTKLTVLRAQDYGGGPEMERIPVQAVLTAISPFLTPS